MLAYGGNHGTELPRTNTRPVPLKDHHTKTLTLPGNTPALYLRHHHQKNSHSTTRAIKSVLLRAIYLIRSLITSPSTHTLRMTRPNILAAAKPKKPAKSPQTRPTSFILGLFPTISWNATTKTRHPSRAVLQKNRTSTQFIIYHHNILAATKTFLRLNLPRNLITQGTTVRRKPSHGKSPCLNQNIRNKKKTPFT